MVFSLRLFYALLLLCFCMAAFACSKSSTDPPPPQTGPDTTSHNFVWQVDTIGDFNSYLKDLFMVNEDDIWAVGDIKINGDTYNALHWDGQSWRMRQVPAKVSLNNNSLIIARLEAVFGFSSENIWFTNGGQMINFDGQNWQQGDFLFSDLADTTFGSVNRLWGASPASIYTAGNKGNIFYYNGTNWQKLNSQTTVDLRDVYGSPDGSVVWACGYNLNATVLLKISGTTVEKIYEDTDNLYTIRQDRLSGFLTSLWTDSPDSVYVMSSTGMYLVQADSPEEAERIWVDDNFVPGFSHTLRGQSANDLFTGGDFSMMGHYNGDNWQLYRSFVGRISTGAIAVQGNFAVAAGTENNSNKAIILTGRR